MHLACATTALMVLLSCVEQSPEWPNLPGSAALVPDRSHNRILSSFHQKASQSFPTLPASIHAKPRQARGGREWPGPNHKPHAKEKRTPATSPTPSSPDLLKSLTNAELKCRDIFLGASGRPAGHFIEVFKQFSDAGT